MNKCTNPHCHSITADIYVDGSWIRVCPVCGRKEALPSNHRMPTEADKCAGMGYVQAQVMNYAQAEALFREAYEMSADDDLRAGYIWWAHLCCYGIVYVEEIQNKGDSKHESFHYIPQIARFPLNEAALTGCETLRLFNEYMSNHPHAGMRQLANEIEKLYATAHADMQKTENHCDVFIAWHDRPDRSRCQEFARELQIELMLNNKRCFFSPINMKKFRVMPLIWEGKIYAALATAKAFVIVVDDYDALGQGFLGCEVRRMARRNNIESAPIIFSGLSGHTGAVPVFMQDWQLHFENSENTPDRIALVSRAIIDAMRTEPAQSDEGERTIDNFRCFFLNDDEAEITGYLGSATRVIIPGALAGRRVTAIGDDAFKDSGIINITLPEGLERIGCFAFEGCARLTRLSIPQSVTSIDEDAFRDCARLRRITVSHRLALRFPDVFVGHKVEYYDSDETDVDSAEVVPAEAPSVTLEQEAEPVQDDTSDEVSADGAEAVDAETTISDAELDTEPDTDAGAFYWEITDSDNGACITITGYHGSANRVKIPCVIQGKRVCRIGDEAFYKCSSLTSIAIPDSVTSIGKSAFSECGSLTSISIPTSVTSIGTWAFRRCASLTSITIPDSVTSTGDWAFDECVNLTSVIIPSSVTSIGCGSFNGCASLTSVTIPASVTRIGDCAFKECSSLKSITIPDSVTSIGFGAFSRCASLMSIAIPDSVTSIGNSAFSGCGSLKSITIPDSVTSIGNSAFSGCGSLKSITIPASVTRLGDCIVAKCSSLTSITIPDSVTSIGPGAFADCSRLTSITIPNSVTSIGNMAFSECSHLTGITIPDSVTSIGRGVFYGCSNLTSITIPDSVTSIGDGAFDLCRNLKSISVSKRLKQDFLKALSGLDRIYRIIIHYR